MGVGVSLSDNKGAGDEVCFTGGIPNDDPVQSKLLHSTSRRIDHKQGGVLPGLQGLRCTQGPSPVRVERVQSESMQYGAVRAFDATHNDGVRWCPQASAGGRRLLGGGDNGSVVIPSAPMSSGETQTVHDASTWPGTAIESAV